MGHKSLCMYRVPKDCKDGRLKHSVTQLLSRITDHFCYQCHAFLYLQVPYLQHKVFLSTAVNPIHTSRPAHLPTPAGQLHPAVCILFSCHGRAGTNFCLKCLTMYIYSALKPGVADGPWRCFSQPPSRAKPGHRPQLQEELRCTELTSPLALAHPCKVLSTSSGALPRPWCPQARRAGSAALAGESTAAQQAREACSVRLQPHACIDLLCMSADITHGSQPPYSSAPVST